MPRQAPRTARTRRTEAAENNGLHGIAFSRARNADAAHQAPLHLI